MIGRTDILALVPHQGAMCLWDEVLEWDADRIRLRAYNHRDPTHPLRSNDRLRAAAAATLVVRSARNWPPTACT